MLILQVLVGVVLAHILLGMLCVAVHGVADIISDYQSKRSQKEAEKADKERLDYIKSLLKKEREQKQRANK